MINTVIKYIEKTNNSSKLMYFEELFYSHPNYPSLFAITESLDQLGIENIAANVPFKHINELPINFITQLQNDVNDYYFVTKKQNSFSLENNEHKKKYISITELEKQWTGIVFIIEENLEIKSGSILKKTNLIFPFIILLFLFGAILSNNFNLLNSFYLLVLSIGLYFSVEILKTYFKDNLNIESKFCSLNTNFSCNSIINSKSYFLSKYIEFVDLPILFFSISFFSQILGFNTLFYFGFVSLFSIPFLMYSFYLQKIVLKKWCLLCLLIALLVFINANLFLFNYKKIFFQNYSLIPLLYITTIFTILWFILKKQLLKSKNSLEKLNTLLRFKRSKNIFTKVSNKIDNKVQFDRLEKIELGKKNAKNTLTLFLSPSCGHCHVAYKRAVELINIYDEQLKLEICFNLNINNLENPYSIIYKTILYLYNADNKNYYLALEDWHVKNISLNEWIKKWSVSNNFMKENNQIENHYLWCLNNNLNYSPIKIFNDFILEEYYEISDLIYFLED